MATLSWCFKLCCFAACQCPSPDVYILTFCFLELSWSFRSWKVFWRPHFLASSSLFLNATGYGCFVSSRKAWSCNPNWFYTSFVCKAWPHISFLIQLYNKSGLSDSLSSGPVTVCSAWLSLLQSLCLHAHTHAHTPWALTFLTLRHSLSCKNTTTSACKTKGKSQLKPGHLNHTECNH